MFHRIPFTVLLGLMLWGAAVTVRIEIQNAAAEGDLPRRGGEPGKWRISREGTPRDELRGMIQTIGLLQDVFAPLLVLLAVVHVAWGSMAFRRRWSVLGGVVGCVAWGLALYLGYFSSLGW